MREAAIVSTARTGIGKAGRGAFNDTEAPVLAAHAMNAAIARAGIDPARIDDVFYGIGNQWGTQGGNMARLALFAAGIPNSVPAFSLDRKCGSGLTAIAFAARSIMVDEIDVALAGGMESISLTMKNAPRYVNRSVTDKVPTAYMPMIETAEVGRRALRHQPRGAGRIRRGQPAARGGRAGGGRLRRGDRADHGREGAVRQAG